MRAKPATPRTLAPEPTPPAPLNASTYSALVSPAAPLQPDDRDDARPFRYSKDELLQIFRDGAGHAGLGLEVERWDGVVREVGTEPTSLREMGETEKKVRAARRRALTGAFTQHGG